VQRALAMYARQNAMIQGVGMFALGALLSLAFAPFHVWPALLAVPVLLVLLHATVSRVRVVWLSVAFGYGFFMAGTYWIAYSLLVDAENFAWLVPFSVLGLSAAMASWFGLFGWLFARLRTEALPANAMLFALLWLAMEAARSFGMLAFPWNLLGYAALPSLAISQFASVLGVYGLSALVLVVTLLPVVWRARGVGMAALLLLCVYGYGHGRLQVPVATTDTEILVVQPNIPQTMKWSAQGKIYTMQVLRELSGPADVVIWPETALPFTVTGYENWPEISHNLLAGASVLITGVMRHDSASGTRFNSLMVLSKTISKPLFYDKRKLVPFGEFVPFRSLLPLEKITHGSVDFSPGTSEHLVRMKGLPAFMPLICYEAVFAHLAGHNKRAAWLLNLTNDAWFGESAGLYQHAAQARMRAIEQGLPMVRAANTGISFVADGYGRVQASLPPNVRGVLRQKLPAALLPTMYARTGNMPLMIMLVLALLAYGRWWFRRVML
jgi:apolipoprotein N-acyltransferase